LFKGEKSISLKKEKKKKEEEKEGKTGSVSHTTKIMKNLNLCSKVKIGKTFFLGI